ncbi:MAG: thioesterase family protein [Rhizobacter sp.]|nr:thioesterase family protein [Ferruginibacter sp.]
MARIKIDMPAKLIAEIIIRVRITDINYGNHLGNDALVGILQEARVQWLTQLGYTELDVEGQGLIMSELAVAYRNESFYGDTLLVKIFVGEKTAVSFELFYHIFNQAAKEIAKAKTGMVCYNYAQKKVAPVPQKFLQLI